MKSSSKLTVTSTDLADDIQHAISVMTSCLKKGNKIVVFGNGGSAADAQHFAAELLGRFKLERKAMPSIALTTDTSALTAIGNDYGFEFVFSRQCEALVVKGDIALAISTSGKSKNIVKGVETCKARGAKIISLTGGDGGKLKNISDINIIVPSNDTAKIQEVHRIILHVICKEVETVLPLK